MGIEVDIGTSTEKTSQFKRLHLPSENNNAKALYNTYTILYLELFRCLNLKPSRVFNSSLARI